MVYYVFTPTNKTQTQAIFCDMWQALEYIKNTYNTTPYINNKTKQIQTKQGQAIGHIHIIEKP